MPSDAVTNGTAPRRFVPHRVLRAAQAFINLEASSGIFLLVAAIGALIWANSPWDQSYFDLLHTEIVIDLRIFSVDEDLQHIVNDGLMTLFFFLMGLEIKREMAHGELSSVRRAALPAAAAFGGMLVPALIYVALNAGSDAANGWGIPMATDIAFALGVLSLLGNRIPFTAKVFLLALAIADDIGAILVIAVFYTAQVDFTALLAAGAILGGILLMIRTGVRSTELYLAAGVCLWAATFESGVHATLAGVALGLLTPAKPLYDPSTFATEARGLIGTFEATRDAQEQQMVLAEVEDLSRGSEAPLERLERALHPWVSYLIVPLFALMNAGVSVSGGVASDALSSPVSQGVALGLLLGKPLGIFSFTWLAVRAGIGELPRGVSWSEIFGIGLLGGIGFTVSLLVTSLALPDDQFGAEARLGVLGASVVAGIVGYTFLLLASRKRATLELNPES
ncbi:MAG: Na+/H+ antiporter NhaA [Dehalococcoidia bacterium]